MLVGRDPEITSVSAVLQEARAGRGAAAAVVGTAGIGKTALLIHARAQARDLTVVAAIGFEREANLPFAALGDLVEPIAGGIDALPTPQRDALAGALALGPPRPGDRFAVCVAFRGLTALSDRPLLVLVDDVQWLDEPSRECVEYLARRPPPGVAVLIALRDDAAASVPAGLPLVPLGPLDDDSAAHLVTQRAPDVAPAVTAELVGAAAGTPLLLVELAGALSADERTGRAPLPRLPVPGDAARRIFGRRLDALSGPARTALLAIAAHGDADLVPVVQALSSVGVDRDAIEEIEAAGLAHIAAERIELLHPLVGALVYHDASGAERRRIHAALAGAMAGDRGAWHLAEAAVGPSADAADALERLAADAAGRRAHATAAIALERAAQLSPSDEQRGPRLLQGGHAALSAGRGEQARRLLREAVEISAAPELKLQASHLLGHAEIWGGDAGLASAILQGAADEIATAAPAVAAGPLADASLAAMVAGDCRLALERADRAADLLGATADLAARAHVIGMLTWALVLRGHGDRARPLLAELDAMAEVIDPHSPVAHSLIVARNVRLPTEEHERARADALEMVTMLRAAGALTHQVMPLLVAAESAIRLGRWQDARDDLSEAMELADTTGQRGPLAQALTQHARLLAASGDVATARADIERARAIAEPRGIGSVIMFCHSATGFAELGCGNVDGALPALEAAERTAGEHGLEEPTQTGWAADLVEALMRTGRRDDAVRVQLRLAGQARSMGTACAAALAERCAGVVAADDGDDHFAAALAHHDRSPVVFERGRTLLAHGAKLRRAGRRSDARGQLHAALDVFDAVGADAWAESARAELRVAGGRLRASGDGLTPAELRVARLVAAGTSNKDTANHLYLSQRTVEFHLSNVYRKLGVRSRTQLAIALNGTDEESA